MGLPFLLITHFLKFQVFGEGEITVDDRFHVGMTGDQTRDVNILHQPLMLH
jgi:hypothetical protein